MIYTRGSLSGKMFVGLARGAPRSPTFRVNRGVWGQEATVVKVRDPETQPSARNRAEIS